MTNNARFRQEALEYHRSRDGLGPALGQESGPPRPRQMLAQAGESLVSLRERMRGRRGGGRVPVCFQTQVSDCGPACLVMTLGLHGIAVELEQVRQSVGSGRGGASARALLEAARSFGLKGRGVRTDLDGLRHLPPGTLLFWNFDHFVVLERSTREYTDIVDPAFGRRRLSREALAKAFTGVALEFQAPFERTERRKTRTAGPPSPWHRLRHLLPPKKELAKIGAVSTALMGFEFALPLVVGFLIAHVLSGRHENVLWLTIAVLGALCVLFLVLQLFRSAMLTKRQAYIEKRLTWGVMEHLTSLPYDFFTVHSTGDLALRVRTSSTLNHVLSVTAMSAALDSALIVVYLVAIVIADPVLALLVIGLIAVQFGLLVVTWRRQLRLSHEVLEQQTRTQNELLELLESITTLKAAGAEAEAAERWSHALVREVNKRLTAHWSLSAFTSLSRTLQFAAPMAVLLAGAWRAMSGEASLGGTVAFMTLTVALFAPLESMFDAAMQLASVGPALAKLDDILRAEPEPRALTAGTVLDTPALIAVDRVSYRYPGADRPALTDVQLTIEPGEFFVILGRSGSGKSTLGMLLASLRLPTTGTITVDGADLAEIDRPTYRRQIGYVNQNAHLFGGTIRENITFGLGEITEEQVIEAVGLARVHDEIAAMPMGYDTLVGPGGHGLSGGQRQRIILARALARRPRLLILDEATSALNPALEEEILTGLMGSGITVVAIAHRLTVLERADRVAVVQDGKIIRIGPPDSLKDVGGEFPCLV
ncbi:peptidase domain-containing ABC transporter [Streptomyces varsoviensis]|uniref:peptidase domain-containing ABC transporter n=1 Tax=Streptomyces varsoviensis TaxID=67373 RepID=UPI0033CEAA8D